MSVTVIGIDYATEAKRVGLAWGVVDRDGGRLVSARTGEAGRPAEIIEELAAGDGATLLALDAPLGWPTPMAIELSKHTAGEPLRTPREEFFNRLTDRTIRQEIGKLPLEVGANFIARTAHAALSLLEHLRERTGQEIPLAWSQHVGKGLQAIEVYPAATLLAHGIPGTNYRKTSQRSAREKIVAALATRIELPQDRTPFLGSADALDAAVCFLAGVDFLSGETIQPSNLQQACKEGWIWVRRAASG